MSTREIVNDWFEKWESGNFHDLPLTADFSHTSPFGTTEGKKAYLGLVEENRDKFLGYTFDIEDMIVDENRACIRYRAIQGDFSLDVSEWHYLQGDLIHKIIAYYHIGEIREERQLQ